MTSETRETLQPQGRPRHPALSSRSPEVAGSCSSRAGPSHGGTKRRLRPSGHCWPQHWPQGHVPSTSRAAAHAAAGLRKAWDVKTNVKYKLQNDTQLPRTKKQITSARYSPPSTSEEISAMIVLAGHRYKSLTCAN